MDTQRQLKAKYDKLAKSEKLKKKKRDGNEEDHKILIEQHKEKQFTIQKRREFAQQEFEKALREKEAHFKQKMQVILENKRKKDLELQQKLTMNTSNDLGDSKGFTRARTAGYRTRGNSSHYSSQLYKDEDDDDEEELQRKLEDYEAMLHRAELLRQMKLDESIEKVHKNNELIYQKQSIKQEKVQQSEYQRLRELIEHFMARQKKNKKRTQDVEDLREHRQHKQMEALEHKKHKLNDLNSQFRERLQQIEKKREEKEAALFNTKSVFGQFNTQKKEITQIKKQDQESNLLRHRRIQSAYKRLLVEKLQEKEDRQSILQLRKEKIQLYQQVNGFDFKHFIQRSNEIHSQSYNILKKDKKGGEGEGRPGEAPAHN